MVCKERTRTTRKFENARWSVVHRRQRPIALSDGEQASGRIARRVRHVVIPLNVSPASRNRNPEKFVVLETCKRDAPCLG